MQHPSIYIRLNAISYYVCSGNKNFEFERDIEDSKIVFISFLKTSILLQWRIIYKLTCNLKL